MKHTTFILILFLAVLIQSCQERRTGEMKPTDSMMMPAPSAPTPAQDFTTSAKNNLVDEKQNKSESDENEWTEFRNNEDRNEGKKITWIVKVLSSDFGDNIWARLHDVSGYDVIIGGSDPVFTFKGLEYLDKLNLPDGGANLKKFPKIHDNDWLTLTGKFYKVTGDGMVVITPIKIQNHGTIEP
jgi:hypothetical protein